MLKLMVISIIMCANAQTTRISIDIIGGKINQDVTINRIQNTMTVSVGKVSHLPAENNYHSSINLHDYTRKMLAIKDIDTGECTITENTNDTLSAVETILLNMKVFNYQHRLTEQITLTKYPMKEKNLTQIAGKAIAEFCNGYKIFRGIPVAGKERRVSTKTSGHRNHNKKCAVICILCLYGLMEQSSTDHPVDTVFSADSQPFVIG